MSLTTATLRKLGEKAANKRNDRKARQCPAQPSGKPCRRTVAPGAGADATCGKQDCGLWMLAQDESTVKHLLGL